MRTEDSNNTHKKFDEIQQNVIYDGVLQPAIVLKMTGRLLLISEAAIFMCLKNNFFRKIIGKTLPLA